MPARERRFGPPTATGKTADDEQLLRAEAAVRHLVDTVLCHGLS
jgi:hypothetical protein